MAISGADGAERSPAAPPCVYDPGTRSWSCWPEFEADPDEHATPRDHGELLRIVSEHFRLDIVAFWTHATVYIVLQGALFTVFASTVGAQDPSARPGIIPEEALALILAFLGIGFAVAWFLTSLGRQRLITRWRQEVLHHEGHVDPVHRSYGRVERYAHDLPIEPTRVTLTVPVLLGLGWVVMVAWLFTRL